MTSSLKPARGWQSRCQMRASEQFETNKESFAGVQCPQLVQMSLPPTAHRWTSSRRMDQGVELELSKVCVSETTSKSKRHRAVAWTPSGPRNSSSQRDDEHETEVEL